MKNKGILIATIILVSFFATTCTEAAPVLKVVSPNGGKKIERGPLTLIEWRYSEAKPFAFRTTLVPDKKNQPTYELLTCNQRYGLLRGNYVDSIDFGYDTKGNVIPDGKYKLKIEHCDPLVTAGEFVNDMSNKSFKLVTPKVKKSTKKSKDLITIVSPNGGETFMNTDVNNVPIAWSMKMDDPYSVSFFLIPSEKTPFNLTNPTAGIRGYNIGGTGSQYEPQSDFFSGPWIIGSQLTGEYKIRAYIFKYDKNHNYNPLSALDSDESDGYFKIIN